MIDFLKRWLAWHMRRPNPMKFDFTDPKSLDDFNGKLAIWRGQKPRLDPRK